MKIIENAHKLVRLLISELICGLSVLLLQMLIFAPYVNHHKGICNKNETTEMIGN